MTPALTATYRLQFNKDFRFEHAEAQLPYLQALGISHVYASPVFTSRPGSTHGYDMVNPAEIDPELGGEAAFRRFTAAVAREGLGLVLDIVPNHMATDRTNPAWMTTLAFGQAAPEARLFDIDWNQPHVLLPVLGEPLDALLGRGELKLARGEAGLLVVELFGQAYPLRPRSVASLLRTAGQAGLAAEWDGLEGERADAAAIGKARDGLRGLEAGVLDPTLAQAPVGDIVADQRWRLVPWQTAHRRLTHRRFFNITELIGVRVEDPWVFDHVHRLPIALVREGVVQGLRVDHVDGLADPAGYCARLREAVGPEPLIVVEKILEGEEELRAWPIDGTTGYERLNDINALFVAPEGMERLDRHLAETGLLPPSGHERLRDAKRLVLEESFGSEITGLVRLARPIEGLNEAAIRRALLALVVACPVYRSYAGAGGLTPADEGVWATMLAGVREAEPDDAEAAARLLDRMRGPDALTLRTRFQQLTGPAMAKGLEDTEFYRGVALLSVNEVGGDPDRPSRGREAFHAAQAKVPQRRDLVPLATHDTKRGADTRARLNLLSLDPEAWLARAAEWSGLLAPLRGPEGPDALDEWMIFQTLFAAWPLTPERLDDFLVKAMREAKRHTRWETPNEAYEGATRAYARALLEDERAAGFRDALAAEVGRLALAGRINGVAQAILQLTVPGTPDVYQGTEFWDLTLVDPDNRRPVDYEARAAALEAVRPGLASDEAGTAKLGAMHRLLAFRREHPEIAAGLYVPLVLPPSPERWIGFERQAGGGSLLVVVPTRVGHLGGGEPLSVAGLPGGAWVNVLSGEPMSVGVDGAVSLDPAWPFLVLTR